jgi:hypothetical protein
MTLRAKNPTAGGADGPLELSSYGGVDLQANIPNEAPAQAENDPAQFTCASMRADELRGCLIRAIACAAIHGSEAQIALQDGDDATAIIWLRRQWLVTRTSVAVLAAELGAVTGGRP